MIGVDALPQEVRSVFTAGRRSWNGNVDLIEALSGGRQRRQPGSRRHVLGCMHGS
jgi:hypothetical protein